MTESTTAAARLLLVGLVAHWILGCGSPAFDRYRKGISENQQALQRIKLGMSSSDVRGTMGSGEIVRYKKIYLVDPWRSESFSLVDGTPVLLLFYVTQPPDKYSPAENDDLTPIVLESDKVVGWGWSYLQRNYDRYRVSVPQEQR